jgi:type IV pilus assembly protein PilQ
MMKKHTLVFAAMIAALALPLATFAQIDDGSSAPVVVPPADIVEPSLDATDTAAVDTSADPVAEAAGMAEEAEDAASVADLPAEEPAATDESVIELSTEREEASGIEVTAATEGGDRISLSLDNVPIQDVIRMFTRISGANIVAGTNLTGTVTVSMKDVEWQPALRTILDVVDMVLVEKSTGIYTVMSKNDLAGEPVVSDTVFLNFTTVSNILPVVQKMLTSTNASVAGFPSSNALIIQETRERLNLIKETVGRIDKPRSQVLIEAKFVELNDSAISDLGINWEVMQGYTIAASGLKRDYIETRTSQKQDAAAIGRVETDQDTEFLQQTETIAKDRLPNPDVSTANTLNKELVKTSSENDFIGTLELGGRNFEKADFKENTIETVPTFLSKTVQTAVLSAEDFALTLSALKQNDGVTIVSNPKIIVASGETALIHVGRNEPNVIAVPQGDTGDRYAYQLDSANPFIEIGVKLHVTPTVNTESNINVIISPELSRKLGDKIVGEAGTTFPITQIRKLNTEFNLESGRTVAIGGLTQTDDKENVKKIPVLGDIPVIGKYLFRHTHKEDVQDEVIIFVSVGVASPQNMVTVSGIPQEGLLIHKHLAQKEAAAKAKEEKARKEAAKRAKQGSAKR